MQKTTTYEVTVTSEMIGDETLSFLSMPSQDDLLAALQCEIDSLEESQCDIDQLDQELIADRVEVLRRLSDIVEVAPGKLGRKTEITIGGIRLGEITVTEMSIYDNCQHEVY